MSALLRTKRIVWAAAFFFASLVLAYSYVSGRRYVAALDWVEHSQSVGMTLERVLSGVRNEESVTRGFVLTGDPSFLAEHDSQRHALEGELRNLRGLVAGNEAQRARAGELERLIGAKLDFLSDLIVVRVREGAHPAEARIAERGKILMDRVTDAVARMAADEAGLLEQRRAQAAATQRETVAAIVGLALAMLVLLGGSFVTMQRDANELRQAAAEVAESEERYRILVDNVSDLVALHGPDGELLYVSPSLETLLGYPQGEGKMISPFSLLHPDDVGTARYNLQKFHSGEAKNGVVTCRLRRIDGEYRWFEFKVTRVDDRQGHFLHVQSAGRDVTARRQLEQRLADQAEELRNLSLRDGLTGLYNRRGFLELSAQVVRVAEREKHGLAVLFVDLDGLKDINDRLGHGHGDGAIREVGELLRGTCRATDLVARLGGDEFVVLASNVDDDSVGVLKGRLERAVSEANRAPVREYALSFSLGIARFDPAAPVAIEALLVEADARMYEAKARQQRPRSRPVAASSSLS